MQKTGEIILMDSIDRKQIDKVCKILRETKNEDLAIILEEADIIPKLYQAAFVESRYQLLKGKQKEDMIELTKDHPNYLFTMMRDDRNAFDAVMTVLRTAHDRQDEICDFADSPLPESIVGRCQYENHYENNEGNVTLTEEEQKVFEKINDDEGFNEAWDHFVDKINPDNQKLGLVLDYNDDQTKVMKDNGIYACENCMEEIQENSDGGISCDMEIVND